MAETRTARGADKLTAPNRSAPWSRPPRLDGCGLGLRRDLMTGLEENLPREIDFFEVAPENWIHIGGSLGKRFRAFTERHPFVCHGLSLSIGGPSPLDMNLLSDVKAFIDKHQIMLYSEHLSYCSDDGHLYDLMPIPFTDDAVHYVAGRIRQVQDFLGQRIAIENTSAYLALEPEMDEITFINRVLEEADCLLLLDINNVYVNSINFGFDPSTYLDAIPAERIAYMHIAGHAQENPHLIVDTHGAEVIDAVWDLLDRAYSRFYAIPTVLERDFNLPELSSLVEELKRIALYRNKHHPPTGKAA